jgi:hypothetical protein
MSVSAAYNQPSSPEQLVVVEIVDGTADQTVVHQPIHPRKFAAYDFPPATWAGKCGVAGSVYRHAGMFEDVPVCAVCLALK